MLQKDHNRCKRCNSYIPISDKNSHLNSDEHKQRTKEQYI